MPLTNVPRRLAAGMAGMASMRPAVEGAESLVNLPMFRLSEHPSSPALWRRHHRPLNGILPRLLNTANSEGFSKWDSQTYGHRTFSPARPMIIRWDESSRPKY